jgi:dihydroflavonol-4-reductase
VPTTSTLLVTGATGLIGSNVCQVFREAGWEVIALARPGADTAALEGLGCRVARGDVRDPESLEAAGRAATHCIHTAAVVNPAGLTNDDFAAVNTDGTRNILDLAEKCEFENTLLFSTSVAYERSATMNERSPVAADGGGIDPYSRTKAAAYRETTERVERGARVLTVLPSAAIGPAPMSARAAGIAYNARIAAALRGELPEFPAAPVSAVLAEDVAAGTVAALREGRPGERYLLWGRMEDVTDAATLLNRMCEAAGVPHRVRGITAAELAGPAGLQRWGASVARSVLGVPDPLFDNSFTVKRLGYQPADLDTIVERTARWLSSFLK